MKHLMSVIFMKCFGGSYSKSHSPYAVAVRRCRLPLPIAKCQLPIASRQGITSSTPMGTESGFLSTLRLALNTFMTATRLAVR